jgi:lipoprotein-releasing system permease protein
MSPFLPFEVIAAFRFLLEGRRQSLLTIIGAAVGVSVVVFMASLLAGVQANIFNRVLSTQAHIVISPPEEESRPIRRDAAVLELPLIQKPAQRLRSIDQWQAIAANLRKRPGVVAVSPAVTGAAFGVLGDVANPITLTGIQARDFYRIIDIPGKIVSGTAELTPEGILVGTKLASDLGLTIGEKLRVRTNRSAEGGGDQTFVVDGIFDLGSREANERTTYVSLRAAQSLLGLSGGVTALSVNLEDPYAAETVAEDLRNSLGVNAESWIKTFEQVFTALRTQSTANYTIQFFVGVAVALGISSVLVVSVVQRSREIGILRAMGASRGRIRRVFLTQGATIGLLGSLAGSLLGIGFILLWRLLARNPDGTEFFPVDLQPLLFLRTALIATVTGVLTALLPAQSAARLNPVDAIRG